MKLSPSVAGFGDRRGAPIIGVAAALFGLGLAAGATMRPSLTGRAVASVAPARRRAPDSMTRPWAAAGGQGLIYSAEVVRVIDGDTFEARVRVWPGIDVDTKVRLRGVDAPELHARCADELNKAEAARAALATMLAEGGVAVSRVGIDKYGGRVDAVVATRSTADVSAALLNGGFARAYDGGRRGSWC